MQDLHPDCSAALELIQHLTDDELKDLLNNDERLDGMVKDLRQVKNAEAEREMLFASNKSLAEFNLSHQPRLVDTRQQLIDMHKQAMELKKEVEEKKAKIDELMRQVSLDTTLALFQTAAAQMEEETENVAQNFLESQLSVDLFLEMFLEKRKLMHLRRVKTEKMSDILEQLSRHNNVASFSNARPSPLPSRPAPAPPLPNSALPRPYPYHTPAPPPFGYRVPNYYSNR